LLQSATVRTQGRWSEQARSDRDNHGSQEFDTFSCGQFIAQLANLGAVSFDGYSFKAFSFAEMDVHRGAYYACITVLCMSKRVLQASGFMVVEHHQNPCLASFLFLKPSLLRDEHCDSVLNSLRTVAVAHFADDFVKVVQQVPAETSRQHARSLPCFPQPSSSVLWA